MSDTDVFTLHPGCTPLLISVPHVGTVMAPELQPHFVERALAVEDTDWHLPALYEFARGLGAGLIVPNYSRYVIDLNRPPENAPMYPGVNNTELCPTRFFSGDALYRDGEQPDAAEVSRRLARYWQPYHAALEAEMARLEKVHGHAILFDAHSIRSELPWLFEGRLPDLNLGTAGAKSCAASLRRDLTGVLEAQSTYTNVVDGRFKGGYVTRHHGRPARRRHAVQLEMTWRCYMRETSPYEVDAARAAGLQPVLRALVQAMLDWTPHG